MNVSGAQQSNPATHTRVPMRGEGDFDRRPQCLAEEVAVLIE